MERNIKKISLLMVTALIITYGCTNPLREKSQCEKLCEQMNSECNVNCPADRYDPVCHSRCDNLKKCLEACNKPIFQEGNKEKGSDTEEK